MLWESKLKENVDSSILSEVVSKSPRKGKINCTGNFLQEGLSGSRGWGM